MARKKANNTKEEPIGSDLLAGGKYRKLLLEKRYLLICQIKNKCSLMWTLW